MFNWIVLINGRAFLSNILINTSALNPTKMAGLKDVVTREYTINMHKRVCQTYEPLKIFEPMNMI